MTLVKKELAQHGVPEHVYAQAAIEAFRMHVETVVFQYEHERQGHKFILVIVQTIEEFLEEFQDV